MIKIIFNHHQTFEDAKNDWNRRIKRINFNKILVVAGVNNYELQYSSKYNDIIFPKFLICDKKIENNSTMYVSKYMNVSRYPTRSKILSFSGVLGKRNFDFLPYVKAIKEIIEKR